MLVQHMLKSDAQHVLVFLPNVTVLFYIYLYLFLVLIHAGSGGVGQSAINICLSFDCEIFTTVGSEEKKQFILNEFPQIKEDHIFNSRSTQFELQVLAATNGRGVDIVLNSLADDKLKASLRCQKTEDF